MARLTLALLGGFQAQLDSGPPLGFHTRKAQALLAYLASPPGQPHPRDKLTALLWGELDSESARSSLRQALYELRKALGAGARAALRTEGDTVALDPDAVDVDVATFIRLSQQGTPEALAQIASCYRGDLLEGLSVKENAFEQWLMAERDRLRELAIEGLAALLSHQRGAAMPEAAIRTAVQLLALDPLHELVHRTLMRVYAEVGRRGAALRQYQQCVTLLQRELGVEPETETRQLYQEILQRRSARGSTTATSTEPAAIATSPDVARAGADCRSTETPLVGRAAEMEQLSAELDRARAGSCQLIALVGEAGIGKSRIIAELIVRAEEQASRVLLGRAYESDQILPFGPWVDAFRTGRLAQEHDVIEALGPVWRAELARLLPEVAEAGTEPPAGPVDYRRLFEGVIQLIRQLAARRTLLLVLEDLHWADEMSVRLSAFLRRHLEGARVLVVITARAEELVDAPALRRTLDDLNRTRQLVSLHLMPLSRSDTVALVRMLSRAASEAAAIERVAEQVWIASEGNPFMVVETMRALQDGVTPTAVPLPQRVRDVIGGRLERLSSASRSLLGTASVIGREFEFQLLPRASGLDEDSTAAGVEELVRRRLLTAVGEQLDFTHDRIREVAYSQLLPWRRKRLHHRVAESIEALHADNLEPHCESLGIHYRAAEAWDKATAYLHRAGNKAVSRSAYRAAVAYFEQSLAALEHLPESPDALERAIDVRLDLRNSLVPLGETDRITDYLREAEAIAIKAGDQRRLGWVSGCMTGALWRQGQYRDAISCGERALAIADALGDQSLDVESTFYVGTSRFSLGDYDGALASLEKHQSLRTGRYEGRQTFINASVSSRLFSVLCHAERGDFAEGLDLGEEAVRIAEEADQPFYVIVAVMSVGELHLARGDFDRSIATFERALELCRTWDIPFGLPWVTGGLGYAHALSGRPDLALPVLEQVPKQTASVGLRARDALYLARLGEAHAAAGRLAEAAAVAERALRLAREREERAHTAWIHRLLGEIASRQVGTASEPSVTEYGRAIALGEELGMRPLIGRCHLGLGELLQERDRPMDARAHYSDAIELFAAMGMTFWSDRAERRLRELAGADG